MLSSTNVLLILSQKIKAFKLCHPILCVTLNLMSPRPLHHPHLCVTRTPLSFGTHSCVPRPLCHPDSCVPRPLCRLTPLSFGIGVIIHLFKRYFLPILRQILGKTFNILGSLKKTHLKLKVLKLNFCCKLIAQEQ